MKDAIELYRSIRKDSTDAEKLEVCKAIMEVSGDRAMAIHCAKFDGWWKDEVVEPCQATLEAPGNRAWAIYAAKSSGWWKDEVAEPCQAIMEAPGNRAYAISCAKTNGWWKDEVAEPCQAIMEAPGEQGLAIHLAKVNGWWEDKNIHDSLDGFILKEIALLFEMKLDDIRKNGVMKLATLKEIYDDKEIIIKKVFDEFANNENVDTEMIRNHISAIFFDYSINNRHLLYYVKLD